MTREELAGKAKKNLIEIAKSMGVKATSKLTREELIEHILLLDPPFSANPEDAGLISRHLESSIGAAYLTPPVPRHLTQAVVYAEAEQAIPPDYNDTRIVLLVRDPYWLHCYWNINQETRDRIASRFGDLEELTLALRVYDITGIDFNGLNSNYFFDIAIHSHTNNWYINVGNPDHSFCVDLGIILPDGGFYLIARSNTVTTPRDNISDAIDEEWMVIEEDFKRLYRLAGVGPGGNSAELVESLILRLEKEIGSGAISSLASPVKYQPKERRFWLVLNTELIVYGATEPNAQVTFQQESVKLRPDGTFSFRLALPEGTQFLPVVAHSADGVDSIAITPIVSKETK